MLLDVDFDEGRCMLLEVDFDGGRSTLLDLDVEGGETSGGKNEDKERPVRIDSLAISWA